MTTPTSMSPRARRLVAESQAVSTEFAGHPYITVTPLGMEPADVYRVQYRLRGVVLGVTGQPVWGEHHSVRIQMPTGFPRVKPVATMETPIFHPNIGARPGEEVCIGDYWSPAESLVDIVVTIGELIQYQRYNLRSPLNAVAARWSAENGGIFPVGKVSLYQAEPIVAVKPTRTQPEIGESR